MTQRSLAELVEAARGGDASAYEELYRQTANQMMGLALSMLKHEQDTLDVLQDSYLYAFGKLDGLEKPEAFSAWLYRLVANRCKNHLTRTRPKLFAASLTDEEGEEWELEDRDSVGRPDDSLDNAETRRLVMEMVDALPEDQRICVLLHYFQEMKVSEIATLLEVSENTVKSRLNYARKKLRAQAEVLERQGTRLHGIALLPLLSQAAMDSAAQSLATDGPVVLQEVLQGIEATAGVTAAATAGGSATTAATSTSFLSTVGGKVTVGIVTAAVALGGAAALFFRSEPELQPEPAPVVSEIPAIPLEEPEPEPEPVSDGVTMTFLFQDESGGAFSGIVAVGIRMGNYSIILDDRVIGRSDLYSEGEQANGQTIITSAQAQELGLLWDFSYTSTSLSFSTRENCSPAFYYQWDSGSNSISRLFRATSNHTVVVRQDGNGIQWK